MPLRDVTAVRVPAAVTADGDCHYADGGRRTPSPRSHPTPTRNAEVSCASVGGALRTLNELPVPASCLTQEVRNLHCSLPPAYRVCDTRVLV